ncbi:MAG: SDR family NAD(P)-dependent oxidoreductase [Magnetovibrio sp.]|nr:SDR family NAD(P)-dependent oxidoreductase [Magnetovibrio sp.]
MPKTPDYFVGKTIFITGAASGIGRETARIFAREGAAVACTDVDADGARAVADEISAAGGDALGLECDVTDADHVRDAVAATLDAFGSLNFQFNSAGSAMRRCPFLEIDEDLWDRTFDQREARLHLHACGAAAPAGPRQRGVIVNVASMSVKRGGPGASVHYAAAKGAVTTMTMGVAREYANRGIRCLSISPGPIDTAFAAAANTPSELVQQFKNDVPMKRFGEPEEIGELVLFMCSDACEYMTADTVYVNGGGGWR